MGTDLADVRVMQIADILVCFRRAADRVIEDEGRPHPITSEDLLGSILASHRFDTDRAPRSPRRPVKFGFRIDDDDEHRCLLDWPFPTGSAAHLQLGSDRMGDGRPIISGSAPYPSRGGLQPARGGFTDPAPGVVQAIGARPLRARRGPVAPTREFGISGLAGPCRTCGIYPERQRRGAFLCATA